MGLGCAAQGPTCGHRTEPTSARGLFLPGARIIKPQPVFTVVPAFHQLSSPILYFIFFWGNSALFNKKNRLLWYTWALMIDSQVFLIIQLQGRPCVSKIHPKSSLEKKTEIENFPAGCQGLRHPRPAERAPTCPKRAGSAWDSAHLLTQS